MTPESLRNGMLAELLLLDSGTPFADLSVSAIIVSNAATIVDPSTGQSEIVNSRGLPFGTALHGELTGLVLNTTAQAISLPFAPVFFVPDAGNRTLRAGTWLICYCTQAFQGERCSSEAGFAAQVGALTVVGPTIGQEQGCTLGLPCEISIKGYGLDQANAVMLVDASSSCGSAPPLTAHDGLVWPQRPVASRGPGHFAAGLAFSGPVGPSVAKLCWGAKWFTWADFNVEVGVFFMAGPQQKLNITCTYGIGCDLPVSGFGLDSSSEVWIIGGERPVVAAWKEEFLERSCRVANSVDAAVVEGFTNPIGLDSVGSAGNATYAPGVASAGSVGPFFRICWRHSSQANFVVEVGRLELRGVKTATNVCQKGYRCILGLGGYGLDAENSVLLVQGENCSSAGAAAAGGSLAAAAVPAVPEGLLGLGTPVQPTAGTLSVYDLGIPTTGEPGLRFLICWLGRPGTQPVKAGTLQLAGPADNHQLFCDSGQPCIADIRGQASPLGKEYWMVTGSGQYVPNFAIFLSSRCTPTWGTHARTLQHTWRRISAGEDGLYYLVSGDLQACAGYMLHFNTLDCSVVASPWNQTLATLVDLSKAWIMMETGVGQLGNDELGENWVLSLPGTACSRKMLTAEAGTLRGVDFFRTDRATWRITSRVSVPWPHRSSLLLLPEGTGCNTSTTPAHPDRLEKVGFSNPGQCCQRAGQANELQLTFSLGVYQTGSGTYDVCWGASEKDGAGGGAKLPAPAAQFPVFIGKMSLMAPAFLGLVPCVLGLECRVSVLGMGLSEVDSIVVHSGTTCSWPDVPPFSIAGAPDCSLTGSDGYVLSAVVGSQRYIVSTTCPNDPLWLRTRPSGTTTPKALSRTFYMPLVATLQPEDYALPLLDGAAGVALDGLAISGAKLSASMEVSDCGLATSADGAVFYATAPGMGPGSSSLCPVVDEWAKHFSKMLPSWANSSENDSAHAPLLGFMMDGVPLFGPLYNESNYSLDRCGGHAQDQPFYHYHASSDADARGGQVLGCLRGVARGGGGFAALAAPVAYSEDLKRADYSEMLPAWERGDRDVLLANSRVAQRYPTLGVGNNGTQAQYLLGQPGTGLRYALCWGRGTELQDHLVQVGTLQFFGPFRQDFNCTLALPCQVRIQGFKLNSDNRMFLIRGRTCNRASVPTDMQGLAAMPLTPEAGSSSSNSSLYYLATPTTGDVGNNKHKLCWAATPTSPDSELVEVGVLDFYGPLPNQAFTCVPARKCGFDVKEYAALQGLVITGPPGYVQSTRAERVKLGQLNATLPVKISAISQGLPCGSAALQDGHREPKISLEAVSGDQVFSESAGAVAGVEGLEVTGNLAALPYSLGMLAADFRPGHFSLCWHPGADGAYSGAAVLLGILTVLEESAEAQMMEAHNASQNESRMQGNLSDDEEEEAAPATPAAAGNLSDLSGNRSNATNRTTNATPEDSDFLSENDTSENVSSNVTGQAALGRALVTETEDNSIGFSPNSTNASLGNGSINLDTQELAGSGSTGRNESFINGSETLSTETSNTTVPESESDLSVSRSNDTGLNETSDNDVANAADTNVTNSSVDAAEVLLAGPYPHPGTRCVTGRECSVLQVQGVGLENSDLLAVREAPCGSYDNDLGDGRLFAGNTNAQDYVTQYFSTALRARYVRIYPTKWERHISMRAGLLVQICPTCVSFSVVDLAYSLRSFSSARPITVASECFTCGKLDSTSAWIANVAALGEWYQLDAGQITQMGGVVIRGRQDAPEWVSEFLISYSVDGSTWTRLREVRATTGFPNGGIAVGLLTDGVTQFTWPGPLGTKGGLYQLCWLRAAAPKADLMDFVTPLSILTVDGPYGFQEWHCRVAKSCKITGLRGQGLQKGDLLRPLPHCSIRDPTAPYAVAEDAAGTVFDWGPDLKNFPPRGYRMCWCRPWNDTRFLPDETDNASIVLKDGALPGGCGAGGLLVDAGVLRLVGPIPDNNFTCYAGEDCKITPVQGEQLKDGDLMLTVKPDETCGSAATTVVGMPDKGFSEPGDTRGTRFYWRSAPVTASGADYRLCWCSPTVQDCSHPSKFDTNAGTLRLVGPVRDQTRTCVGGLQCTVPALKGNGLSEGDELLIQTKCDADLSIADNESNFTLPQEVGFPGPSTMDAKGDFNWLQPNRATGGIFRLCWRAAGRNGSYGGDAGELILVGPRAMHKREAYASLPLIVGLFEGALEGTSSRMGDRVKVSQTCGSGPETTQGIGAGGVSRKLQPNATAFLWGDTLLSAAGGVYRLCWCAGHRLDGTPRACTNNENFLVDAGTLSVEGPLGNQSWTCSTSRSCSISGLRGAGLTGNDRLLIKVGDCLTGGTPLGLHWATEGDAVVNAERTEASFTWGTQTVAAQGGHYRVCFCTYRGSMAGDVDTCSSQNAHRFTTDAGTLTINGPRPAHAPWAMQLGGNGRDIATKVLVDSSEPEKGLGHALMAGTTDRTIINPSTAKGQAQAAGMTWTAGRTEDDWVTVKCGYTRGDSGAQQWEVKCRFPRLTLQPLNLSNQGQRDTWVTKVGYNGSVLWTRQIGSYGDEELKGLAINRLDHSIVIAGSTTGNMVPGAPWDKDWGRPASHSGGRDCFVVKMDQFGEYLHTFQFGSLMDDYATGVEVASDGIYVVLVRNDQMLERPSEGGIDSMVVRFTHDLTFVWGGLIGSEGDDALSGILRCTGARDDGRERLLLFGYTTWHLYNRNPVPRRSDIIIVEYSTGPYPNFEKGVQYGSAGDEYITAAATALDGSIYVAGYSDGNLFFSWVKADDPRDPKPGGWDGFVMKLDPWLSWIWTQMPGTKKDEYIYGMAFLPGNTDEASDLLVSGVTNTYWPEEESRADAKVINNIQNSLGHTDAWLMTLSTLDGSQNGWQKQIRSPGDETIYAIAAESAGGHAYIAGTAKGGLVPEIGATPLIDYGEEDAFLLKLVWGRAAASCFRGSACEAGIPSGVGLGLKDKGVLTPTRCSVNTTNAPGIPNTTVDGSAVDDGTQNDSAAAGSRQRLKWGDQAEGRILMSGVGRYVLCWCAEGCEGAVPLEVSVVFITGPSPGQWRTCVRGEFCDLTGIQGRDIDNWDRVSIQAGCGTGFVQGIPRGGYTEGVVVFKANDPADLSCRTVSPNEMEGVASNFGCERVTATAGSYNLCFCTPRGSGAKCEQPKEFSFTIGTILIQGPERDQARKCMQNYRCVVDGILGQGLRRGDLILVLDVCRMPQTSPAKGNMTIRGIAGLTPGAAIPADEIGNSWLMGDPTTAAAGTYRMCWCRPSASARGCSITDDYVADIGPLTIVAPKLNHLRSCVRGQTCAIIDLEGYGLGDGDKVMVLKFCPRAPDYNVFQEDVPPPGVFVDGWPREGLSLPAEVGGRSVSWGVDLVQAEVGIYPLCWCMGSSPGRRCEQPQDFYVLIGEIELAGPVPRQEFTAVAGHPLVLPDLLGYGMNRDDKMAIVPPNLSCESPREQILQAAYESGFPSSGILQPTMTPYVPDELPPNSNDTANFSTGSTPVARGGGHFALCQRRGEGAATTSSAAGSATFTNRGYVFLGCGDEEEARAACNPRSLPMPKNNVSQANLKAAILAARAAGVQNSPCGQGVWLGARWFYTTGRWDWDDGVPLSDGPVDETDGAAEVLNGRYMNWAQGQPSAGAAYHENEPSIYLSVSTMQWHDARPRRASLAIVCQEAVSQVTGNLQLQGPLGGQVFTSPAGRSLNITDLKGVGLKPLDLMMITYANASCGDALPATQLGGEGISYLTQDGTIFAFPPISRGPGGRYQLCWCRKASGITDCRRNVDFVVTAGHLILQGPLTDQMHSCRSGRECTVALKWDNAVDPEKVDGLLSVAPTCSTGLHFLGTKMVYGFPGGPAEGNADFNWTVVKASAGLHKLCWCALPCKGPEDKFAFEVGQLEIEGPYSGQRFSCVAGRRCVVAPLQGVHLQNGDQLRLSSAVGGTGRARCGSSDAGSSGFSTAQISQPSRGCGTYRDGCTFEWPDAKMAAVPPGSYGLCWCRAGTCEAAEDFTTEVGDLQVVSSFGYQ
eukprot:TRINITY_DN24396_c0_g2_i1.p1 TRINITY_DN24396_c0_g2~~TRINITY_DN24396_c0_g2_i1.p1  ORF type:complete len:4398 (+),score=706.18 TRINITY_DN24396_c0_g2_i1:1156-13194(+)